MKRIAGVAALILVPLLGFYAVWPAWSAYVIRNALQNQDESALAAKVDFDRVKESLRPFVAARAEEGIVRYQSQLGGAGAVILEQLKKDAIPKLIDASLHALLTPAAIIRIASEAGSIRESVDRMMRRPGATDGGDPSARPGLGGLLGKVLKRPEGQAGAPETPPVASLPVPASPQPAAARPRYGLANIKSFAFNGPLSFRLGVAKKADATDSDVTAEMSFTGFDWKLTGLVPRG